MGDLMVQGKIGASGRRRWWETAAGVTRPSLKAASRNLIDLTSDLDEIQWLGFDAIEVFAPCHGGTAYGGLDTIDFKRVDPAIGTMVDFQRLVDEAHSRGIAIVPFLNLGYVHEQYPAFLRACDDVFRGDETADTRLFLWSDDPEARLTPPGTSHFLQDADGHWHWSARAARYYWVKWSGEEGDRALPQLNWADEGWQIQAAEIMDFWLGTGADGIVVDAVNWYIGADWPIVREALTAHMPSEEVFVHPEGAGGFADDPVPWIVEGGFSLLMDYGLKIWWDDIDVVKSAVLTGDHTGIGAALAQFRDPVVAAGGACYIHPPRMRSSPQPMGRLAAAVVATVGELYFDAFGIDAMSAAEKEIAREMLLLRKRFPALAACGERVPIAHDNPAVYAFVRHDARQRVVVALNFSAVETTTQLTIPDPREPATTLKLPVTLGPYDFQVFDAGSSTLEQGTADSGS